MMTTDRTADYWYHHRRDLCLGMIFRTAGQGVVMLDGYVPGDGTRLYVADRYAGSWCHQDSTVEPGDLVGEPITEEALAAIEAGAAIARATGAAT